MKFDDFFNIIEDKNKRGQTIYRLQFKVNNELVPNGMTNKQENIMGLGHRWLKKNPREVADMIFEMEVLMEPREGFDPSSLS